MVEASPAQGRLQCGQLHGQLVEVPCHERRLHHVTVGCQAISPDPPASSKAPSRSRRARHCAGGARTAIGSDPRRELPPGPAHLRRAFPARAGHRSSPRSRGRQRAAESLRHVCCQFCGNGRDSLTHGRDGTSIQFGGRYLSTCTMIPRRGRRARLRGRASPRTVGVESKAGDLRPATSRSFLPSKLAMMPSPPAPHESRRELGDRLPRPLVDRCPVHIGDAGCPWPMTMAPPPVSRRPISVPVAVQASRSSSASMF